MRIKWAENNRKKNAYDIYLSMSALEDDRKSAMPDQVSRIILIIANVVHATVCMWVHVSLARIGCTRWPFVSRSKSHYTSGWICCFFHLVVPQSRCCFPNILLLSIDYEFSWTKWICDIKKNKNCFVREIFEIFVPYLLKWSVLHTCTSTHALGKNIVRSVDLSIIKVVCIEIDYVFCLSHLILGTNNTPMRKAETFYWQWKYLFYYLHSFRLTLLTFTNKSDSTQLDVVSTFEMISTRVFLFATRKLVSVYLFVFICVYFAARFYFNVWSHLLGLCFNFFRNSKTKNCYKTPDILTATLKFL